jgi:hypothetical protein
MAHLGYPNVFIGADPNAFIGRSSAGILFGSSRFVWHRACF